MRRITDEVCSLVDGVWRLDERRAWRWPGSQPSERTTLWLGLYQAFRKIKAAFDPHNLFNPGKVVDAPAMTGEPALWRCLSRGSDPDLL